MSSLKVDCERLTTLGTTLTGLGAEAKGLLPQAGANGSTSMKSLTEARSILDEVIRGSFIPTVAERLSETGEVMTHVAKEYLGRDKANSQMLGSAFTAATSSWSATEPR